MYATVTYTTDWTGRAEEPVYLFETKKEACGHSESEWKRKMRELGDRADASCSTFNPETGCGCAVDETGETCFFEVREAIGPKTSLKNEYSVVEYNSFDSSCPSILAEGYDRAKAEELCRTLWAKAVEEERRESASGVDEERTAFDRQSGEGVLYWNDGSDDYARFFVSEIRRESCAERSGDGT